MEKRYLGLAVMLFFIILLLGNVSSFQDSLESLGTFKLGEDVLLTQTCGNCNYNNVTSVTSPDNASELITNEVMTKDRTKYTLLLDKGNITVLGTYNVNGVGDKDGSNQPWAYTFTVTNTGELLDVSESIIYILLLIGSFILFAVLSYFAIVIPFSNDVNEKGFITKISKAKYLKILCIWFAHGSLVWSLTLLLGITNNFLTLQITLTLLQSIYILFYVLFWANTLFLLGLLMVLIYKDILLNKELIEYGKAFIKKDLS